MQCSMNSNEPPLGEWIEDSVKFHGCSMQEPPPDGSGGLLALGTLSLPSEGLQKHSLNLDTDAIVIHIHKWSYK